MHIFTFLADVLDTKCGMCLQGIANTLWSLAKMEVNPFGGEVFRAALNQALPILSECVSAPCIGDCCSGEPVIASLDAKRNANHLSKRLIEECCCNSACLVHCSLQVRP